MKIHLETACLCQKGVELWLYMYYWMNSGNSHDLHVLWVYTIHNNITDRSQALPGLVPRLSRASFPGSPPSLAGRTWEQG